MEFYRYEREVTNYTSESVYEIILNTFFLIKETNKGYWIGSVNFNKQNENNDYLKEFDNTYDVDFKKWIPKESVKRFAYPSKKEALFNFKKRTEKSIKILSNQLITAKKFNKMCDENILKSDSLNLVLF